MRVVTQTRRAETSVGTAPRHGAPGIFATVASDAQLGDGISTLTTDRPFAWIVAVPLARYDPVRDLLGALFWQWLRSLHLVLAVTPLGPLPARLTVDP